MKKKLVGFYSIYFNKNGPNFNEENLFYINILC